LQHKYIKKEKEKKEDKKYDPMPFYNKIKRKKQRCAGIKRVIRGMHKM
jgi:hypothetical protein